MRKIPNNELNRLSIDEFKSTSKIPLIIILDDIRSLNNIGSVFRTADAFLVQKVYLCGITAKPPHREIQKTALGATESVDWEYNPSIENAIAAIKAEGYKIIGIEQTNNSTMLDEFLIEPVEKIAIVFGNEVKGINDHVIPLLDGSIEIPQFGTKHSLNISVCAGIVIWDLFKKFSNYKK